MQHYALNSIPDCNSRKSFETIVYDQAQYAQKVHEMAQVSIGNTQKVVSIFLRRRIAALEKEMHAVCKRFQDHVSAAITLKDQGKYTTACQTCDTEQVQSEGQSCYVCISPVTMLMFSLNTTGVIVNE